MTTYVVDASVAAKWYFPEEEAELALQFMPTGREDRFEVVAPELIVYEMGNLVLRKLRVSEVEADVAKFLLRRFLLLPLRVIASDEILVTALEVGRTAGLSYYDACYVATAVHTGRALVTADSELMRLVSRTPYSQLVVRLADAAL